MRLVAAGLELAQHPPFCLPGGLLLLVLDAQR